MIKSHRLIFLRLDLKWDIFTDIPGLDFSLFFLHIIIYNRPSVVAVLFGEYTQKFKVRGYYIEKVL